MSQVNYGSDYPLSNEIAATRVTELHLVYLCDVVTLCVQKGIFFPYKPT